MNALNDELLDNKNHFDWSKLLLISLVSIVVGIYRDGFSSIFPFFQREFDLTRAQLGLYTTTLYIIASLLSLFTGRLVDIKGSKWGLSFGVFLIGILLILHSFAPNYIVVLALAALAGFGVSINAPAANKSITEWFGYRWRSVATGIWSSALPLGALVAAISMPFLGTLIGWQKAVLFPGIAALLSALVIHFFYQDKDSKKGNSTKGNAKESISFWKGLSQLVVNTDLIAISFYGFFLGAIAGAITSHFTLFLFLDYGFTESVAGLGFAISQFGSILGKPMWGFICDKFLGSNKRKAFLWIGFSLIFTIMVFIPYLKMINSSLAIVFFFAFLIGFTGRGWHGLFFSSVPEMVDEEQVGLAIGLAMLFMRMGLLVTPPVFGYIADLRNSYDVSWVLLSVVILIASISQYIFHKKRQNNT